MKRFFVSPSLIILMLAIPIAGCEESGSPALTTNMHEDFDHKHQHKHGEGSDHEHEHQDSFEGSHSHQHSHHHRHGEPLFGGKIASIGHSHHKGGETHYHAEVMPITDGIITFHLLTETSAGKLKSHSVPDLEIESFINEFNGEPIRATELNFVPQNNQSKSSTFTATIPEKFRENQKLLIVVPKITLGGERLNFSFTVNQNEEPHQSDSEPDSLHGEKSK